MLFISLLLTFVTLPVVPVWLLLIVLIASAILLWGWLRARTNYQDHLVVQQFLLQSVQDARAEEDKEAETRQQAHKSTISVLLAQLTKLEYVVRGTDEASEQEYRDQCQECGEEYEMLAPLEGAAEFALEIACLHKVLSAIHNDLDRKRIADLNIEFYQNWANSLECQVTSWDERRRAILRLENLAARLNALEKILQSAHGVKTCSTSYSSIPVKSYQNLFDLMVPLREFLELKLKSKTADLVKEATQFTHEVEHLEWLHETLDGALTVAYEATTLDLKQVALSAWDDVIAYAFESSPANLVPYHQESWRKYEDEYARAMTLLAKEGECAQRRAVEHLSTSIKHWGFWRALSVAMIERHDAELLRGAYDQFLRDVEAKISHSLQELKRVMGDPFVFDDEFVSI